MNNLILSIRKKISAYYSTITKQPIFINRSISTDFNDLTAYSKNYNQKYFDLIFKKTSDMAYNLVFICTSIESLMINKYHIPQEMITNLDNQIKLFDEGYFNNMKYLYNNVHHNPDYINVYREIEYIERASEKAHNFVNVIKQQTVEKPIAKEFKNPIVKEQDRLLGYFEIQNNFRNKAVERNMLLQYS